jgi:hypothetical protein
LVQEVPEVQGFKKLGYHFRRMEFTVLMVQVVSRKGAKEKKAQRGFSLERKWGFNTEAQRT